MTLADAIRVHIGPAAGANAYSALLAVVDKCQAMRAESDDPHRVAGLVGHTVADGFEALIARELGIEI